MTDREPYPEHRTTADHVRTAAIVGVSAVPWMGGPGAELLNAYLPSALERRRDRWFKLLDERLADVEGRVLDDDAFQTVVLNATRAALGTHLEEKLQLLAASVRSSADVVDRGDDTFMTMKLLQWVEELEPIHFAVLSAIRSDDGWGGQVTWKQVLSQVKIADDEWYTVVEDLQTRHMVNTTGHNPAIPTAENHLELIWAEPRGRLLMEFVQLMAGGEHG